MTETQPTPDPKPQPKPEAKPEARPERAAPGSVPAAGAPPPASASTSAKPQPAPAAPRPAPAPSRGPVTVLTILGFVLLAIGLGFVWTEQQRLAAGVDPDRLGALEAQFQGISQRVSRLEQRPPADLKPLEARVSALEKAPATDLRPLQARLAAVEQREAAPAAPSPSPALEGQLAALQQRVAQAEQAQAGTAARATRLARLQSAAAALAAGRPLGEIPAAPAALARFATTPPPTEAALRLDFETAAARAAEASRPATESESLAERMWLQIQSLVTVRDGDRVLSGAPATYVLGAAREQLSAGNLAGAVAAIDHLDKGAASAMADWSARAHALLDARAALATMMAAD